MGTIHANPIAQLNIPMSNIVITGTKIVPDKSGNWCARKEWVMLALSSMILRIRPLVFVSKKPRGIFTILRIASFLRFDSTRNAAKMGTCQCQEIEYYSSDGCSAPNGHRK